jgi:hypothetical protein
VSRTKSGITHASWDLGEVDIGYVSAGWKPRQTFTPLCHYTTAVHVYREDNVNLTCQQCKLLLLQRTYQAVEEIINAPR